MLLSLDRMSNRYPRIIVGEMRYFLCLESLGVYGYGIMKLTQIGTLLNRATIRFATFSTLIRPIVMV